MQKVRLGRTELMVSELGFGGIPIVGLGSDQAEDVVRHCFERGINFFDTANMYGDSESKLGRALGSVRDQVILATKSLERGADGLNQHLENSLKCLATDYIDVYQLHSITKPVDLEQILAPGGALEAVVKAKEAGKVRFIGISSHARSVALKAIETGYFDTVQFPFNFVETDADTDLFPAARERDMGIIGMKPLGGGMLSRADLCFKFLQQNAHVVPIPGFSSIEEADEVIDLYENRQPLTDADQAEMEAIKKELGSSFCHRCGYCLPCEQGVMIPESLMFRPIIHRLGEAIAVAMSKPAVSGIEECTQCGECAERCPYGLPVPELLAENLALFRELEAKFAP
ncbi:aldo/keto reductase [Desulfatibacillum aliphaticivorans]|uniref:aldo/keto reductase n=1 Tax=Desulfatibacillum aliphaticivorans TaxID=218208 RepID=UPI0004856EF6|nr:aldo/keto reductase [Desulfatibacillum aliphaticivorans]